jgi:hypothetical protein
MNNRKFTITRQSIFISIALKLLNISVVLICFVLMHSCSKANTQNKEKKVNPISENNTDKLVSRDSSSTILLDGIIYLSTDHGRSWVNASHGLPDSVKIGLGGIATSHDKIAAATKENGVYIYENAHSIWNKVPTNQLIIQGNIGAMTMMESTIFVGTQHKGVFITHNQGVSWMALNLGLEDLTIRRFCEIGNKLFVCTNDGFYSLNQDMTRWQVEYKQPSLQVNGATMFHGQIFLATNRGIFHQDKIKIWNNSSPQLSMHNISSDNEKIYAMTYNQLLLSSIDGLTWQSQQNGFLQNLYTFNVVNHNDILFAGQWDGVYSKGMHDYKWKLSSNGLPKKFAVTNLKTFDGGLIISTSERKLKSQ